MLPLLALLLTGRLVLALDGALCGCSIALLLPCASISSLRFPLSRRFVPCRTRLERGEHVLLFVAAFFLALETLLEEDALLAEAAFFCRPTGPRPCHIPP